MKTRMILTGMVAALLAMPSAARAADLAPPTEKTPAYFEPPPVYATWTGFYLGINGGYGFGTSDWASPGYSLEPSGGIVGGTVGYNFQAGGWVLGVEGDFDWADLKADGTCFGGAICEISSDWFGTARLRLGYAGASNWLPYITGGAAFAALNGSNSALAEVKRTRSGWTAGAGIEYAWSSAWSAKVEYLYADLGDFDCGGFCAVATPYRVDFTTNVIRGGINYRF